MNFITDLEFKQRTELVTQSMLHGINPETGFGIYRRSGETNIPGMTCTYGMHAQGYPDIVISGTTDLNYNLHLRYLDIAVGTMLNNPQCEDNSWYAGLLNLTFSKEDAIHNCFPAVINTEQFLTGYGMNLKRFYHDVDTGDLCIIQLITPNADGLLPVAPTAKQMFFPVNPYGVKEVKYEPVLLDPIVPGGSAN